MRSPLIAERGFAADGRLQGKEDVRPYWQIGLAGVPPLKFELIAVHAGVGALALVYRSHGRSKRVIERIEIDTMGRGCRAEALYCDD